MIDSITQKTAPKLNEAAIIFLPTPLPNANWLINNWFLGDRL